MSRTYKRSIAFTTTSSNYDLLTDTNVKAALVELTGTVIGDLEAYILNGNLKNIYFSIILNSDDVIIINDGVENATYGTVYSSGDFITGDSICSIKVKTSGLTGKFIVNTL